MAVSSDPTTLPPDAGGLAIRGGAINLAVTYTGMTWSAARLYQASGDGRILAMAALCAAAALGSV